MEFLKSIKELVGDSLVFKKGDRYYAGQVTDKIYNLETETSYDYNINVLVNEDGSTVPALFFKYSDSTDVWYSKDPIKILPGQDGYDIIVSETSWTEPDLTDESLLCTVESCDTKPVTRNFTADRKPSSLTEAVYNTIDKTSWGPNEYVELGEGLTTADGRPILGRDGNQIIEVWYLNPTTNQSTYILPPGATVRDYAVTTEIGRQFQELKDSYNALILKGQAEARTSVAAAVAVAPNLAAAKAIASAAATSGPKYSELPEIKGKFKELMGQKGGALKELERWQKALKSGVPEPGVRRKMAEAGESQADIDNFFANTSSTPTPTPSVEVSAIDLSDEGVAELMKLVTIIKADPTKDLIKTGDDYPLFEYSGTSCKVKEEFKKKRSIGNKTATPAVTVNDSLGLQDFKNMVEYLSRPLLIGNMYSNYVKAGKIESFGSDLLKIYPGITSAESLPIIQEQITRNEDEQILKLYKTTKNKDITPFFAEVTEKINSEISKSHVMQLIESLNKVVSIGVKPEAGLSMIEELKKRQEKRKSEGLTTVTEVLDRVTPYESYTEEEQKLLFQKDDLDKRFTELEKLLTEKVADIKRLEAKNEVKDHHIKKLSELIKEKNKVFTERKSKIPPDLQNKVNFVRGISKTLTTTKTLDGSTLPEGWKIVVSSEPRGIKYQEFVTEGGKIVAKYYDKLPTVPTSTSTSASTPTPGKLPGKLGAGLGAGLAGLFRKGGSRRLRKNPKRRSRTAK